MSAETGPLAPMPEDWRRALAVVAHPDDLEYGASGAVARWTAEGRSVSYLLASSGEAGIAGMSPQDAGPLREEEQRAAAAIVGVAHIEFLGYPDGVLEYGLRLRRDIASVIRQTKPELVLTLNHRDTWPGGWLNMADHRNVGLAVLDAVRDAGNRWVFQELLGEGLEPWDGVRYVAVAGSPRATHAVDITDTMDRAVSSLTEHRAYLKGLGQTEWDANTMLRELAAGTGRRFGDTLACGFELFPG